MIAQLRLTFLYNPAYLAVMPTQHILLYPHKDRVANYDVCFSSSMLSLNVILL